MDKRLSAVANAAVKRGKKIVLVVPPITSPTGEEILAKFKNKFPGSSVVKYDPLHSPAAYKAWSQSYRGKGRPVINLEAADIIVDL